MTTERSVSRLAWADATMNNPVKPGGVRRAVDSCMAELCQKEQKSYQTDYSPWLKVGGRCFGAMWAGVPKSVDCWRSPEGFWIISSHTVRPTNGIAYTGLFPASLDAEVQYGFCPIRLDKLKETTFNHFGPKPIARNVHISSGQGASFRSDRMAIAAAKLGDEQDTSRAGRRFKKLLGNVRLSSFVEEMLRGVYADHSVERNIIKDRPPDTIEIIQLVTERAYSRFLEPFLLDTGGMHRFRSAMGVTSHPDWRCQAVSPMLYSVVVPAPIFEAIDRNFELGIPPIVPQYVTCTDWMFNGRWHRPCVGFPMSEGRKVMSDPGSKVVSGVIDTFNSDLPGGVSYWSPDKNPPAAWVDSFVGQLRELREQGQPVSQPDKADLAMLYARNIPVVLDIALKNTPRALRYSKLVKVSRDCDHCVKSVSTQECNAQGEWTESSLSPGTSLEVKEEASKVVGGAS